MKILTNGFYTNLPDSQAVSQGGPAIFARLFVQYIQDQGLPHEWIAVMLEKGTSNLRKAELVCEPDIRRYYKLFISMDAFKRITHARYAVEPRKVLRPQLRELGRLMQEERPDVVFLNGFGILNWLLMVAAKEAGVPVVVQHAGIWQRELRLHAERYSGHGRRVLERMEEESSEHTAVEIFLNRFSRHYYRTHVAKGSARRTEVVPLPFNFAQFKTLSENAHISDLAHGDPGVLRIGTVARWDKIKNHEGLLALAQEASQQHRPWQFYTIADAPQGGAGTLYRQSIRVLEPQSRGGVSAFCRAMDLLVVPSLFDVSPTVVLEAIALGTPVVISPTVGFVSDFIEHGAGAWVIDIDAPAEALQKIANIAGKPMPEPLRAALLAKHDHATVFTTYLQLFSEAPMRQMPMGRVITALIFKELERVLKR